VIAARFRGIHSAHPKIGDTTPLSYRLGTEVQSFPTVNGRGLPRFLIKPYVESRQRRITIYEYSAKTTKKE
jgi:hypothetical protein